MFELALDSFVTSLVVAPLGLAPTFAAPTTGCSEKPSGRRRSGARCWGAAILLIFALAADVLLGALVMSIPAFRVAAGTLPFLLALGIIFAGPGGLRCEIVRQQEEDPRGHGTFVFPLPSRCSPGRRGHDYPSLHRQTVPRIWRRLRPSSSSSTA